MREGRGLVDRPDLKITGTDTPELYQSEHYSMDSFTVKVPNGKYNLMLHFSEDYDGLTSPTGDRLFTVCGEEWGRGEREGSDQGSEGFLVRMESVGGTVQARMWILVPVDA